MLKDKTRIKVVSGMGGRGSMALRANRAFGGDGGNGGKVYLKGTSNLYDLSKLDYGKKYKADDGGNGLPQNRKGEDGKDLIIQVPLVSEVYIDDVLKFKVEENEQLIKILDGGEGGLGNVSQKKVSFLDIDKEARNNAELVLDIVLKLQSDVIFIGYPNAGKSSLLNELTNAKVKTASYEFTTLEPQLAFMDAGIKLMDLPGLIDGTSEGKGLGTRFVKHTENCKLVAHFVALDSEDPFKMYNSLREEIKKIDTGLYDKDEAILLTKTDDTTDEKLEKVTSEFKAVGLSVIPCSIIDDNSIQVVKDTFIERIR
jgi:GTP-binding protein